MFLAKQPNTVTFVQRYLNKHVLKWIFGWISSSAFYLLQLMSTHGNYMNEVTKVMSYSAMFCCSLFNNNRCKCMCLFTIADESKQNISKQAWSLKQSGRIGGHSFILIWQHGSLSGISTCFIAHGSVNSTSLQHTEIFSMMSTRWP